MFQIDVMSRVPVYEQIVDQVEMFLLTGILKAGDKIPSVRSLSIELSVNPNTIQKAFTELDSRKLIYSVPGRGCYVAEDAITRLSDRKRGGLMEVRDMIKQLALAGVSEDEVDNMIDQVYTELKEVNGK